MIFFFPLYLKCIHKTTLASLCNNNQKKVEIKLNLLYYQACILIGTLHLYHEVHVRDRYKNMIKQKTLSEFRINLI